MLKKIFLMALILLLALVAVSYISENQKNNPQVILNNLNKANPELLNTAKVPFVKDGVYRQNRRLIFSLKYADIIPLGTAIMTVGNVEKYKGRKVYHLTAEATVSNFFALFYKGKARVESLVDTDKLYPLLYKEEMFEKGELNRSKQIEYDQRNLVMLRDGKIKRKIVPNTFDPISSIFYLRARDFDTNKTSKIMMVSKEDVYLFETKVLEKNNNIWQLESEIGRLNKSSSHGAKFVMWLTADSNRLPLLIKVKSKAGPFTMRLEAVE